MRHHVSRLRMFAHFNAQSMVQSDFINNNSFSTNNAFSHYPPSSQLFLQSIIVVSRIVISHIFISVTCGLNNLQIMWMIPSSVSTCETQINMALFSPLPPKLLGDSCALLCVLEVLCLQEKKGGIWIFLACCKAPYERRWHFKRSQESTPISLLSHWAVMLSLFVFIHQGIRCSSVLSNSISGHSLRLSLIQYIRFVVNHKYQSGMRQMDSYMYSFLVAITPMH